MGLYEILKDTATKFPSNLAVICNEKSFTYSNLKQRVDCIADALFNLGINKDHKIAIISKNCHRFLEIYFAAAKIGAILVPINYRLSTEEFIYILNDSNSKLLIAQPQFIPSIDKRKDEVPNIRKAIILGSLVEDEYFEETFQYEELLKNPLGISYTSKISGQDTAQIYYTSGTTGRPKGVILTHKNNLEHAKGTILELQISESDRWLHVAPMFHLADSWAVWSITQAGGAHVMVPCFDQKIVLETIERDNVTLSNFIPTMLNLLVNNTDIGLYDFSSLRLILSGGAPIAKEIVRKVINVFRCDYIQTYGLTETSPFLTMSILKDDMKSLPFEERLNIMVTTGRPFYNVQLKVVGDDGKEVMPNNEDVGEIIVKGDTISPCYWELPEETEARFIDGWLHTHDLAVVNPQGYVTIVDRKDDMIITGGENVYSIEIENVLYSHPHILETAVIGLPDPIWGEMVIAVVALKSERDATESEIIEYCREKLAHFKAPKRVFFVKSLPKTGSAKIYKYKLREIYREK